MNKAQNGIRLRILSVKSSPVPSASCFFFFVTTIYKIKSVLKDVLLLKNVECIEKLKHRETESSCI